MGIRPSLLSLVVRAGLVVGAVGALGPVAASAAQAAQAGSSGLAAPAAQAGSAAKAAPAAQAAQAAQAAPTVEAQSVEALAVDRATLVGTFVAGNEPATASFEYGRTTDYGIGTAGLAAPAGSAAVQARADITGLGSGQTWYYRLVVRSRVGVAYGPDVTLTTPAVATAPLVVALVPSPVGIEGATLRARVDPAGQDTTVVFEYGLSPADFVRTAPVIVGADRSFDTVEAPAGGLVPHTSYVFRVVATNATGTTVSPTLALDTARSITKVSAKGASRTATWGRSTQIAGYVDGIGLKDVRVTLMRQDFPFSKGPVEVGTALTVAGGRYSFTVGPLAATTKFWVQGPVTPMVSSPPVVIYGKLRVALRATKPARTSVTLSGTVEPHVASARATLQRRAGSGRWITVSRPSLTRDGQSGRSTFTATARRYGQLMKYRLLVDPRNGGAHYPTASNVIGVTAAR